MLMKKDINKVVKELANSYIEAFHIILSTNVGINPKVNKNTLVGSNLDKQAKTTITESNDIIVNLLLNDYEVYVQNGRKSKRFPPVSPIVQWARSKGIPTDNSTIFLIRRSIAEKGIAARPIMTHVYTIMDNEMEQQYFDKIFDSIIVELNKFFNK